MEARLGSKFRLTLTREIREAMGVKAGDKITVTAAERMLVLEKSAKPPKKSKPGRK